MYSTTMQHSQWVRVWSATIRQTTQMHSISGHAGTEQMIRVMQHCEAAKTTGVQIVHIHTDPAHVRHREDYEMVCTVLKKQHSQQAYKQYMCSTSGHRRHRADTRAHIMPQGNTATRYRAVTVHRLVKQGQRRLRALAGLQGSKAQWVPLFNQGTESTMRALTCVQHHNAAQPMGTSLVSHH